MTVIAHGALLLARGATAAAAATGGRAAAVWMSRVRTHGRSHLITLLPLLLLTVTVGAATSGAGATGAGTPADPQALVFAVPFTNDAVLKSGRATKIYGLAPATAVSGAITVTVTDDSGAQPSYVVVASRPPEAAIGGGADQMCFARCLHAGFCALGDVSSCVKPSCAMGCALAARTPSHAACVATCAAASANLNTSCLEPTASCNQGNPLVPQGGCNFIVPSPASPHHGPGQTLQNETFSMCADRQEGWAAPPILTNGTQCTTCNTQPEVRKRCLLSVFDI